MGKLVKSLDLGSTDSRENQERFNQEIKGANFVVFENLQGISDIPFENKICYPETIQDNRFDLSRITSYTDLIYLNNKAVRIEDLEIKKLIGII